MKETIIQFGEGNFLRGFFDDFLEIMNRQGLYDGKAVVIKPTPRGDLSKFERQENVYNLFLRGIENGQAVSKQKEIRSISRCINPYTDFEAYIALAKQEDLRFIVSNTTEAGIAFDEKCSFEDRPALSFPGKLTQLLYARYKSGLPGFILLPCELIDENADALKGCVLRYADLWGLGEEFKNWIISENTLCNTLVDRIVTGYPKDPEEAAALMREIGREDVLLDTAEPYHLWAIESNRPGGYEDDLPLQKAGVNVLWTDDIRPVKKRKVRILNGAHTVMVFPALLYGIETVGECLEDETVSAFLKHYLYAYAVPMLAADAVSRPEDLAFAEAVLERFANPYIRHQLKSIALNSVSKYAVRVVPTAVDYQKINGRFPRPAALSLAALVTYYKTRDPQDDEQAVRFIREKSIEEIVRSSLFGADLGGMLDDVKTAYEMIGAGKIREGFLWAIS